MKSSNNVFLDERALRVDAEEEEEGGRVDEEGWGGCARVWERRGGFLGVAESVVGGGLRIGADWDLWGIRSVNVFFLK